MKKTHLFTILSLFFFASTAFAATKNFDATGEVVSVEPVYGRVTIKHDAIKGFSGAAETEFPVASPDLLKNIRPTDLVSFSFVDEKGDVRLEKLERTGMSEPAEKVTMGRVMQDALKTTGDVAKGITKPLPGAHEVVSGTMDATTGATENVLPQADNEVKTKF